MDLWRKMLMADEALRNRTSVAAEQVGNTIKDVVHKTTGMLNELQVSFPCMLGLFVLYTRSLFL